MLYLEATSHAEKVDSVMLYITVISLIFLIGITVTMLYFVYKYNRKRNPEAKNIHGNFWLETVWIVLPTILVLTMFYYGYVGYKDIKTEPGEDAVTVRAVAQMWKWQFVYEDGRKTDTLYVPSGKPVKLLLVSLDVNHSLYIPAYRVKQDVVLGTTNKLIIYPDKKGDYDIACAEYCGLKHSMMYTKLRVMDQDEFNNWYAEK